MGTDEASTTERARLAGLLWRVGKLKSCELSLRGTVLGTVPGHGVRDAFLGAPWFALESWFGLESWVLLGQ